MNLSRTNEIIYKWDEKKKKKTKNKKQKQQQQQHQEGDEEDPPPKKKNKKNKKNKHSSFETITSKTSLARIIVCLMKTLIFRLATSKSSEPRFLIIIPEYSMWLLSLVKGHAAT